MSDKDKVKKCIKLIEDFKKLEIKSDFNKKLNRLLYEIETILKDSENNSQLPLDGQLSFNEEGNIVGDHL